MSQALDDQLATYERVGALNDVCEWLSMDAHHQLDIGDMHELTSAYVHVQDFR
jgi:hypothetical protein